MFLSLSDQFSCVRSVPTRLSYLRFFVGFIQPFIYPHWSLTNKLCPEVRFIYRAVDCVLLIRRRLNGSADLSLSKETGPNTCKRRPTGHISVRILSVLATMFA